MRNCDRMRSRILLPLLAAAAFLAAGCPPPDANPPEPDFLEEAPPPRDPDVVILVDDVEIRASEIDVIVRGIEVIYPEYTLVQRRRLALELVFLPRAALAARHPEAHARAARRCAAEREAFVAVDGPQGIEEEGDFRRFGVDLWSFARTLEPGTWSEPFARAGSFVVVELVRIEAGAEPAQDRLVIRRGEWPYRAEDSETRVVLDPEGALDAARLTILDSAWEPTVTEETKYRMRGSPEKETGGSDG